MCMCARVVSTRKLQDEYSHVFDERMKETKSCSIILPPSESEMNERGVNSKRLVVSDR